MIFINLSLFLAVTVFLELNDYIIPNIFVKLEDIAYIFETKKHYFKVINIYFLGYITFFIYPVFIFPLHFKIRLKVFLFISSRISDP